MLKLIPLSVLFAGLLLIEVGLIFCIMTATLFILKLFL